MDSAAAILCKVLTLSVGLSSVACVERYVVPQVAFISSKAIDADWSRSKKPTAVSATRANDGSSVFVRVDELTADGAAIDGRQKAHTAAAGPIIGGVVV